MSAVRKVAAFYGVTVEDLIGDSRAPSLCAIRFEAFWEVYATGRYSTPAIGSFFGGRDHTTVLNGLRRHEARMAEIARQEAA
jgi:chromosomal replication initiator protein